MRCLPIRGGMIGIQGKHATHGAYLPVHTKDFSPSHMRIYDRIKRTCNARDKPVVVPVGDPKAAFEASRHLQLGEANFLSCFQGLLEILILMGKGGKRAFKA